MSYNTNMDTITVNDVVYNVERNDHSGFDSSYTKLTLSLDGEPVFDGLEGQIGYDEDQQASNPRDWSNVGTMSVSYDRYNLGDEDISKIDFDVMCPECEGTGERPVNQFALVKASPPLTMPEIENCEKCEGTGEISVNPIDYFKRAHGARVVIPLTVYEHSGITMAAGNVTFAFDSDRWDTSFVGFIYDTPKAVKECMGDNVSDEDIEKAMRQEVATYASYLEGDVTYYSVNDEETEYAEGCGGYVGDSDYCLSECFSAMETAISKRLVEITERAYWAARDTVTA